MRLSDYLEKYDRLYSEDSLFQIPFRKEYLLTQIGRGKRVLDVGCLGGQISRLIVNQNNEVWGVEVNPQAAEAARKRGIRVKVADVERGLPFEEGAFDIVNAGEVLENLYDSKAFLMECWRVLKRTGRLLLTASNLNSLENRIRVASGEYLSMTGAYPDDHFGEHIRAFNIRKIRELCQETGFEIEDIRGIPVLESKGRVFDFPLKWVGRFFPGFSKILMITARKHMSD